MPVNQPWNWTCRSCHGNGMTVKHISSRDFQLRHSSGIRSWSWHFQVFVKAPGWDLVTIYKSNLGEIKLGTSGYFQLLFPAVCCNLPDKTGTQCVSASTKKGVGMMWPSVSRAEWCGCLHAGQDRSMHSLHCFAHRTTPEGLRYFSSISS